MKLLNKICCVVVYMCLITCEAYSQSNSFPLWSEGFFDIHHINTARGNATFFIFPDGTTMLFDAGDKNIPTDKVSEYFPVAPNDSLSAGGWIAHYIKNVIPSNVVPQIDYAVVSHFHNDHYGQIDSSSHRSFAHKYFLSGITEVGDLLPIKVLIDRGYPNYNYPVDLKKFYANDKTFSNYLTFIEEHKAKKGMLVESLKSGSSTQIILKRNNRYNNFSVRNVKANASIWSGNGDNTFNYSFKSSLVQNNDLDENALCLALKISYGYFDYYTGGDLNGYTDWGGFDMETSIAKSIGEVEALALNHHGYYDASNSFFLEALSPQVAVHQAIHDPHFQSSVLKRLSENTVDVFAFNMHDHIKEANSDIVDKLYKSTHGHVVIRVAPGGQTYTVYILNDRTPSLQYLTHFGPYGCKG